MSNKNRNIKKALETIVYLSQSDNRNYWILKAIYVADKEHLKRYGRQIYSDTYIAMKLGPVPSLAYDIVKAVRGDGCLSINTLDLDEAISVPDSYTIKPLRKANMGVFSESEIECMKYALSIVLPMNFDQLKEYSHDKAYLSSQQNDEITLETIINSLDNGREIIEYLNAD
jgi:hypothetical protein